MMTIYVLDNNSISLPKATKEDFDELKDFMGNARKKNYIVIVDSGEAIIPKDKILFAIYKEEENE